MQPREEIFYYYRALFKFIYYLGLSPYWVTSGGNPESYILIEKPSQKVFRALIHIILCLASLIVFWGSLINSGEELPLNHNPMRLFYVARALGFPVYVFTIFYCIWFRKEKFLYLLHLVPTPNKSCSKPAHRIAVVTTFVCALALCMAPFHMLGEDYFYNSTQWDFRRSFPTYGGFVAQNLFLQASSDPLEQKDLTPQMISIILAYGFINIYLIAVIHTADCFALVGALALRNMVKEFSARLLSSSSVKSERLIRSYTEMKEIVENVNNGTGPIVVAMFFVTLPYFVENLITMFDPTGDWPLKIRFLYYFLHYFAIMFIASDANHILTETKSVLFKVIFHLENRVPQAELCDRPLGILQSDITVDSVKAKQNQEECSSWKLVILYLETSVTSLGLKGCGFFTITYGFLGSIVGILLTYFIVMVQFQPVQVVMMSEERRPTNCSDNDFVSVAVLL